MTRDKATGWILKRNRVIPANASLAISVFKGAWYFEEMSCLFALTRLSRQIADREIFLAEQYVKNKPQKKLRQNDTRRMPTLMRGYSGSRRKEHSNMDIMLHDISLYASGHRQSANTPETFHSLFISPQNKCL
ncbi:MAG TPA: hypothetical protein DEB05_09460 [Firmicutes bacterium]|jgi:hypothetical protein|nr:hypothetical protein [Bacillota bacterium]